MQDLPPLCDPEEIRSRLIELFPEGMSNRAYLTREMTAKTIFVMLYLGAVEGSEIWARPEQITRMTDDQSRKSSVEERLSWGRLSKKKSEVSGQWYAANTRESIRDEGLRQGLAEVGAVIMRSGLATTSPKGKWALSATFAKLFDPSLEGEFLQSALRHWSENNLTRPALARLLILRRNIVETEGGVMVLFPNGESRRLADGTSSQIAKAVIEEFAPRYLGRPAVILLSESAEKQHWRDSHLANRLGLKIDQDKFLPDIILVDLEDETQGPLFVFVEVVATDGPITPSRKESLREIVARAGYSGERAAFLTAFLDRGRPEFRRHFPELAWGTYAWTVSEPDKLISLACDLEPIKLRLLADNALPPSQ